MPFQFVHSKFCTNHIGPLNGLAICSRFLGAAKGGCFSLESIPRKQSLPAMGRDGTKSLETPGLHVLGLCCPMSILNQMACLLSC